MSGYKCLYYMYVSDLVLSVRPSSRYPTWFYVSDLVLSVRPSSTCPTCFYMSDLFLRVRPCSIPDFIQTSQENSYMKGDSGFLKCVFWKAKINDKNMFIYAKWEFSKTWINNIRLGLYTCITYTVLFLPFCTCKPFRLTSPRHSDVFKCNIKKSHSLKFAP